MTFAVVAVTCHPDPPSRKDLLSPGPTAAALRSCQGLPQLQSCFLQGHVPSQQPTSAEGWWWGYNGTRQRQAMLTDCFSGSTPMGLATSAPRLHCRASFSATPAFPLFFPCGFLSRAPPKEHLHTKPRVTMPFPEAQPQHFKIKWLSCSFMAKIHK